MCYELGGFAEFEDEIDGDFNAFNYCLACEYLTAIFSEDFKILGEISNYLIDKIVYWLNYDGKIGENYLNEIKGISNGNIMTSEGRTFIDAIIDHHQYQIAETYIYRGIQDIKLFLTYIIYTPIDEIKYDNINLMLVEQLDRNKYIEILNNIFSELEKYFIKIEEKNEQKEFLDRVKVIINQIKYPNSYEKIKISSKDYSFIKMLIKNK